MKNQVDVLNGIGVGAVYIGSAKEDSLMTGTYLHWYIYIRHESKLTKKIMIVYVAFNNTQKFAGDICFAERQDLLLSFIVIPIFPCDRQLYTQPSNIILFGPVKIQNFIIWKNNALGDGRDKKTNFVLHVIPFCENSTFRMIP